MRKEGKMKRKLCIISIGYVCVFILLCFIHFFSEIKIAEGKAEAIKLVN